MKYQCCPAVTWCKDARENNCDNCAVGEKISSLELKNEMLKALLEKYQSRNK